jgi:hypothetical protein
MILDTLTYSVLVITAILTYVVIRLSRSKSSNTK